MVCVSVMVCTKPVDSNRMHESETKRVMPKERKKNTEHVLERVSLMIKRDRLKWLQLVEHKDVD